MAVKTKTPRLRLLLATIACGLFVVLATGPSGYSDTYTTCVQLESQAWWSDSETASDGDTTHAHSGVCVPLASGTAPILTGTVTFTITSKLHNAHGWMLRYARIQAASDQRGNATIASVQPRTVCESHDCTFTNTLTINTDQLVTGMHEFRFHTEIGEHAWLDPQLLATNGYQMCVRSCSGVTPQATDHPEGRGWYQDGEEIGYVVSRFYLDEFPWRNGAMRPLSGTWCPNLRTHQGSGDEPIERSRVVIDPDFHAGNSGTTLADQSGELYRRVCVDTRALSNGLHKIVLISYSSATFPGQLWGVLVVPFLVNNTGVTPAPTPTPTPTPTPSPAVAQCRDGVDNDGDRRIDYPRDRQCRGLNDNNEAVR